MTGSVIIGPWPRATERDLAEAQEFVRFFRANITADMADAEALAILKRASLNERCSTSA